ncbi:hypothetical protein Tco_0588285 [Tanacetum coccineum]
MIGISRNIGESGASSQTNNERGGSVPEACTVVVVYVLGLAHAGEGAGISIMSSFAWILRKILPATSEYTRLELDAALVVIKNTIALDASDEFNRSVDPSALEIPGAYWPPIIEEEEMPNAMPYEDSFVEEIVR